MKITEFKDLYFTDFNVCRLFAMNQDWEDGREFSMLEKGRKTSALLYLKDCNAEYLLESGEILNFPKGSIVYIPQNSKYKTRFMAACSDKAYTQLIEFELITKLGEKFIAEDNISAVATDEQGYYSDLFDEAVNVFNALTFSYAQFRSVLFSLIVKIAKQHRKKNINSKEFFPIAPAIDYLEKNPYSDKTVASLADMCHVSESCFRELFKKYSGKTPSEYCLNNKIKKAKKLLQSNMYSVGEIAEILGYDDAGYFTKVFKKNTGILPSEYYKTKISN